MTGRRTALATRVVPRFLFDGGVWLVRDEAGVGKTTNVSAGLLTSRTRAFFACERHEKAEEIVEKNDGEYFHVEGRSRPGMCPVFERAESDPARIKFERFESVYSHREAHRRVDEVEDGCPYLEAQSNAHDHDYVVGVHHQLTQFSDRVAVIDETPSVDTFESKWTTADLDRAEFALRIIGAGWLADWVDRLRRHIANTDGVDIEIELPDRSVSAEELAELKIEFNRFVVVTGMVDPCFDAILGSLYSVGFEPEACEAAIDGPTTLKSCPHCDGSIIDGRCEWCFWERGRFDILDFRRSSYSRVKTITKGDLLVFSKIPAVDDLPDDVMILDATARPEIVAKLFGVSKDEIVINDGPDFEPNMHLTDLSNGQYHGSTIAGSESLQKKLQRAIDHVDRKHDHVFYVAKRSVLDFFDFPDEGNIVRYYGNLRGMDVNEEWEDQSDMAVCLIGANHADVRTLRHDVAALDGDGSGEEYNEPRTVWVDGEPVEVETKAYPGLLGEFFQSSREDELVQAAHRLRPILADETVHVYKLTNVPTRLPVNERLTWNEFLNGNLPDRAIDELVNPLCEAFDGDTAETSRSEIYEIAGVDSTTSDGKRLRRWIDKLEDSGFAEVDDYASDGSKRVILDMDRLRQIA